MEKREIGNISYYLEYKGIKNINMRVLNDGSIKVSAPYGTSKIKIDNLVYSKLSWYKKALEHKQRNKEINNTKGYVSVWGKTYDLVINEGSKRFYLDDDKCYIYYPSMDSEAINRFLKKQLNKMLSDEVLRIKGECDDIILDYHLDLPSEFKYREMTTRWGSCQIKTRVITLNTNLIHYPKECLEYVLLHEYMHLIVPNHSVRFHQLMDYYMPDNKRIKHLLNNFEVNYN